MGIEGKGEGRREKREGGREGGRERELSDKHAVSLYMSNKYDYDCS